MNHEKEKECRAEFHQIYCQICGWQSVLVEPPGWGVDKKTFCGDIMCSKCHLVIGAIVYGLKDLPQ